MRNKLVFLAFIIAALWSDPAAASESDADKWKISVAPYLWLPTISGDTYHSLPPGSGTGSPGVSVGPTDWLDLLNFGALVSGTARKGRVSIFGDVVYLSMGSDKDGRIFNIDHDIGGIIPVDGTANLDTSTELSGLLLTLGLGYAYRETDTSSHSVFAGIRTLSMDVDLSWNLTADITLPGGDVVFPAQGSLGSDTDIVDGIVGLRGEFGLGSSGKWSMPYHIGVGFGDSDETWNMELIAARSFGWGELIFGYRHLYYDEGPGATLQGFSFSGPVFGARFGF